MHSFLSLLIAQLFAGSENPKPVIKLDGAIAGTELFNHEGIDVIRNPVVIIPWDQRLAGFSQ